MTTAAKTRMTVEEYLDRYADDPRWTQLVDGEVVVTHPVFEHGRLQARIIGSIDAWNRAAPGRPQVVGVTGVRLTEHDFYGPDLIVVSPTAAVDARGFVAEVPLLAVEVRSPSTWQHDVGRKKSVYEAQGVPELWLVDGASATVLAFRRSTPASPHYDVALELGREEALTSTLLPGFALPLPALFA